MRAQDWRAPLPASVKTEEPHYGKLFRSYPEVVDNLLQKYDTDQAIAEYDTATLCFVKPTTMTPQKFPDNIIEKSCMASTYMTKERYTNFFEKVFMASSATVNATTGQWTLKQI